MRTLFFLAAVLAASCVVPAQLSPDLMSPDAFDVELERRFQYPPPTPHPAEFGDPRAGRIADAVYFAAFIDYDRSYSRSARRQARRLSERLQREAGDLSHEQFVLRVAEIAALADNGHTAIGRNAFMKNTARLPIRTYLFADGLHVLYANQAHADLLGARIDTIDGQSIEDVYRIIRRYRGGVEAFRRLQLVPMLESPALLQAAGLAQSSDGLMLSGVLADGRAFERRVLAESRGRSAWVSSTQRLLFPDQLADVGMVSFLHGAAMPTYLHGPDNLFWMEAIDAGGLYVRIEHNGDADEGPIADFLGGVNAHLLEQHPRFVVLDMRNNGGGDYTTTYAFARALPQTAAGAPIYVLTSPWTFSAAITTVAALKEAGGEQVRIVGEPVGDRLDFWAEGGAFELPNAFLLVHYASGRHVYDGPCEEMEICFWLNQRYPVRVSTLAPDVAASLTFAAYRQLRDPAMEAVLAREANSGSRAHRR